MIRGVATTVALVANLLLWGTAVIAGGVVKFAVQMTAPRSALRTRVILALARMASRWVAWNSRILDAMLPTRWDVTGLDETLDPAGRYLIISNHISWVDIMVLFRVFHGRVAVVRFFLKQELIWLPIVGLASWALEFPFMKRYTAEYIERHPEKRGKDLETTRRACQRYRHMPVAVANFVEGTRFTRSKQHAESSPYRHLLRPRIGGISYVLASLGDQLDALLDVTIAYPCAPTMWRFVSGELPVIRAHLRRLDVPAEFFTPAITERGEARDRFKAWMENVWREKDALLDGMEAADPPDPRPPDSRTA